MNLQVLPRECLPHYLAGGAIRKIVDGDLIEIVIDREKLEATANFIGENGEVFGAEEGTRRLTARSFRADLAPDPQLPDDARLWAALIQKSGGVWAGCVYDLDAITQSLSGAKLV
jgi:dihydroxyacid dehydratase/phosphogluconate dehydratase